MEKLEKTRKSQGGRGKTREKGRVGARKNEGVKSLEMGLYL